jgi:L-ascorbate metabolism protein UlaG (beta-lactamase superfamily)
MRTSSALIGLAVAASASPADLTSLHVPSDTTQSSAISITFLANEGVMVASRGKKILIDALYRRGEGGGYAVPPDTTQERLEQAKPPFDSVDVVLVTHAHDDHFHPAPVLAHLRANAGSVLLASVPVVDGLRQRIPSGDRIADRLLARRLEAGSHRREIINGVVVEILRTPHGSDADHLAYVLDLGGRRVFHIGDADPTESALARFRLDTARIDIALIPHWMLLDARSRRVIDQVIRAKQVVAMPISERDYDRIAQQVADVMPAAITFRRSLDQFRW